MKRILSLTLAFMLAAAQCQAGYWVQMMVPTVESGGSEAILANFETGGDTTATIGSGSQDCLSMPFSYGGTDYHLIVYVDTNQAVNVWYDTAGSDEAAGYTGTIGCTSGWTAWADNGIYYRVYANGSEVTKVEMYINVTGADTGNVYVGIQGDSSGDPDGSWITNGQSDAIASTAIGESYAWVEFTFSTNPEL